MAQISIPYINKSGYSLYWDSMWDSKINYNKNNKESIFLKYFFKNILKDNVSFFYSNFFKKKHKYFNSYIYNSKIWVIKYQKWVCIYFYFYKNEKNKNIIFKKYLNIGHYNNILKNYLKSSFKNILYQKHNQNIFKF